MTMPSTKKKMRILVCDIIVYYASGELEGSDQSIINISLD